MSYKKSSRKNQSHISEANTADFMTSIQKIYSPEELLTLSKTLAKLTNLIRPPITTPPNVSELIPVMEILRLHLPLLSTLIGLYVSFFPKLFQDQWTFSGPYPILICKKKAPFIKLSGRSLLRYQWRARSMRNNSMKSI